MARDGTGGRRHPISPEDDHRAALGRLRVGIRQARRAVPPFRRRRAAAAAAARIARLGAFRRARDVGLYLAHDGEIDPGPLAVLARRRGKRVWLPVVRPDGRLEYGRTRGHGPLRPNRYGIPEPACFQRERRPAPRLDLLIVPLVAFDTNGRRLGMGGGYYDRALAGPRRPVLVGLAFDLQRVAELPERAWDVPMDIIVTERRTLRPASRKR